jgi:hypothetical protein
MEVQRGRFTADIDGDFVVFLIGMRFNHPLRIRKWWPVASAMPRMLKVLSQHPNWAASDSSSGLGGQQYWSSTGGTSTPWTGSPGTETYRTWSRGGGSTAVRASGDVGIWHETFRIRAGEYEAVYGNMPVFGLAAAARSLPTAQKANTAAARIGASATDEPAAASP